MNLMFEGINDGFVIKTDRATKLTVDGVTDNQSLAFVIESEIRLRFMSMRRTLTLTSSPT